MKKILFYILVIITVQIMAVEKVKLRGYGDVVAEFKDGKTVFTCSSAAMAQRLYSKYCKDILKSGTDIPSSETISGIPVWHFNNDTYGTAGVEGNSVIVLGTKDKSAMQNLLKTVKLSFPQTGHPSYLDYYDHNSFRFYVRSMTSYGESLDEHWPFIKRLGLGGIGVQEPSLSESPAEGIIPFIKVDYEMNEAEKNHGMVVLGPNLGGSLPLWVANKNPEQLAGTQDSMLYSGWTAGVHAAAFESSSLWEPGSSPIIAMQKLIMEHFDNSPALGGWHINRGQPVGDMLGVLMNGCLWDSSAAGKKAYIDYLKKKYTLQELGKRWFGDMNHYKTWAEVKPMETAALLGGEYEKDRLLLSDKSWHWRKSTKTDWDKSPQRDGTWLPIVMPPSHRATMLDSGSGYYKVIFRDDKFLKQHANDELYLKMLVYCYDSNKANVWVNSQKLKTDPLYSAGVKLSHVKIPAGLLAADRENEIIIQTPDGRSDGRIHGPVSLSPIPAENYPFKDPRINAQYVDSLNFQTNAIVRRIEQMIKYARKFDPNRPMVISAGSWDTPSILMPILSKYGVGHQYTAAEGFLNAQYPGIAAGFNYYFSAEPSGAVLNAEKFNRMMCHMLYLGASSFDMFHNIGQYIKFDRETDYLTSNAGLLHLVGKYLLEPTNTAIFWSSTIPLNEKVWNWNLGRGELQSSHYNVDYLNEQALENGNGNKYDLIIDCGNEVLSERAIKLLEKYIEEGGTYVVLPPTGRHGQLTKDSQPISRLSGFQTVNVGKTGNIRFSATPSIFKCWANQTFHGDGEAADWKNVSVAARQSIEIKPVVEDTEVIASWDNGGTAIGLRKLGKGRIITLGSTFWRDGRDINGKWLPSKRNELLATLMFELGAQQTAKADSERIWVRNAVTKNGLEHWLIAVNIAENDPFDVTTDIEFQLDFKPEQVLDRVSGKTVEFKVDNNNRVTLPNIKFSKYQTIIFAIPRSQNLAETAKTWWNEKTKYWKAAPEEDLPMPADTEAEAIELSNWHFLVDPGNIESKNNDWEQLDFNDSGWRKFKSGSWKLLDPGLKNYTGTAIYRSRFNIPDSWAGHGITLNFKDPIAYDNAEFYINGKLIVKTDISNLNRELYGARNFDITNLVDGDKDNVLAVKVTAENKESNLAGLCNIIWLGKEQKLDPYMDLNGDWEVVMGDLFTRQPCRIPGQVYGRYIRRTFDVPDDWKGKTVYLHFESKGNIIGAVMINDKVRAQSQDFSPFPTRAEINIGDLIIPGKVNTIELWQRRTIPVNWRGLSWGWPEEADIILDDIKVGCVK